MQFTPPCEKCIYFVKGKYSRTGSCRRYTAYRGRGRVVYEFADSVRLAENRCGREGRLFKSDKENDHSKFMLLLDDEEE